MKSFMSMSMRLLNKTLISLSLISFLPNGKKNLEGIMTTLTMLDSSFRPADGGPKCYIINPFYANFVMSQFLALLINLNSINL